MDVETCVLPKRIRARILIDEEECVIQVNQDLDGGQREIEVACIVRAITAFQACHGLVLRGETRPALPL